MRSLRPLLAILAGSFFILPMLFLVSTAPAHAPELLAGEVPGGGPGEQLEENAPAGSSAANAPANTPAASTFTVHLPVLSNEPLQPLGSLSSNWYLLVDDSLIAERDLARVYHPFQKVPNNPIIQADRPWESSIIQLYGTVLPDQGSGFRMWYSAWNDALSRDQTLYAESADGITWNKPDLDGQGQNILFDGQEAEIASVIHTPSDLNRAYKLLVYQNGTYQGYYSPNGLRLTPYSESHPLDAGQDVAHAFWDPHTGTYIGTNKEVIPVRDIPRRVIKFFTSTDLALWQTQPQALEPDDLDEQLAAGDVPHFYGMPAFPIGKGYLGLLWVLNATDPAGLFGQVQVQLTSSQDGLNWTRQEGSRLPILALGSPGSWDDGQIYTANSPVHVGDELWLYYSGCNDEHGARLQEMRCSIGLAKAPYNRLASLSGTGTALTAALQPDGAFLHLNYDGSRGEVRVELWRDGAVIPGYEAANFIPLKSNSLDAVASWAGQSSLPAGPFQVKFYLQDSDLFAFSLGDP